MESTYIVSFGNSTKYRITAAPANCPLPELKAKIRTYLEEKFPEIKDLKYYDKITVIPVTPENEAEYRDYPEFTADSVKEIKKVLSTEVKDANSLDLLNSNAAFGG